MAKRDTIRIRAPKDIILPLRIKFPKVTDQDLVRVMYNTSLLKIESGLRTGKKPNDKHSFKV